MVGASALKLIKLGFSYTAMEWLIIAVASITSLLSRCWSSKP